MICKLETIATQTSTAHGTWGPPSRERQRHDGTDFPPSLARCPWERLTRTGRCHQTSRLQRSACCRRSPSSIPASIFGRAPVRCASNRRPGNGLRLPFADLAGGSALRRGLYPQSPITTFLQIYLKRPILRRRPLASQHEIGLDIQGHRPWCAARLTVSPARPLEDVVYSVLFIRVCGRKGEPETTWDGRLQGSDDGAPSPTVAGLDALREE